MKLEKVQKLLERLAIGSFVSSLIFCVQQEKTVREFTERIEVERRKREEGLSSHIN